jgi:hypothetical protein
VRFAVFLPAVAAGAWCLRSEKKWLAAFSVGAFIALALTDFVPLEPDRHKQYWTLLPDRVVEYSEWNAISRVDVIRAAKDGQRHFLIDGDAQAPLVPPRNRILQDAKFVLNGNPAPDAAPVEAHGAERVTDPQVGPYLTWRGPKKTMALSFSTPGWKQVSAAITFRVEGKEASRPLFVHLPTTDLPQTIKVPVPTNRWATLYLDWNAEEDSLRVVFPSMQVIRRNWPGLSLSAHTRLELGLGGSYPDSFQGDIATVAVWDKGLDNQELLSLGKIQTGFERIVTHHLHRELTGKPANEVLVIGNGGAADSVAAMEQGAKSVTAVEINPTSYDLVRNRYADYMGNFFDFTNVSLVLEDGRSFVRNSAKKFDVMTIIGVDSLAAAASGAYVLAENYLYTEEALADYWDHLSDTGILQISRWHFPTAPRETLRVFTMAEAMLRKKGVADPFRHLTVLTRSDAKALSGSFASLLLSKAPIPPRSLGFFERGVDGHQLEVLFHPDSTGNDNAYHRFAAAARAGKHEEFFRGYEFNVRPVTDDSPFLFHYGKWSHLIRPYTPGALGYDSMVGRWPFFILFALIAQCLVIGAVVVGYPLARVRKQVPALPWGRCLGYFACLGVGFMFVEMYLIQRLVLILGHPVYSMGVTLPALLIAAAAGSYFSRTLDLRRPASRGALFAAIATGLVVALNAMPFILEQGLYFNLVGKIGLSLAAIFPVGFLMGMPFPAGLRTLPPELTPLAWASNGAFSVLASVLSVVLAMHWGFTFLAVGAAGLYLMAWAFVPAEVSETERGPARGIGRLAGSAPT